VSDVERLPLPDRRWLTTKQAAEYLHIGVNRLNDLGTVGEIAYAEIGRGRVWDARDLDAWAVKQKYRAPRLRAVGR